MVNALAVTAHHDDAALWMGGALLRTIQLGWRWHIVYMCSGVDWIPRDYLVGYFRTFCQQIGVRPTVFQFKDYLPSPPFAKNRREEMETEVLNAVAAEKYDWVFTHNLTSPGEYWDHANHFEVAQVVEGLARQGELTRGIERIGQFSYLMGPDGVAGRDTASHHLPLTEEEFSVKRNWRDAVPDQGNMRVLKFPCPNPEAFEALELPPPFIAVNRVPCSWEPDGGTTK